MKILIALVFGVLIGGLGMYSYMKGILKDLGVK